MSSIGKRKLISQGGEELHHSCHVVIEFIALLSNEVIFVTAGIIGYRYSVSYDLGLKDWAALGWLYVLIHITRGIVIAVFFPVLRKYGYGLTVLEAVILTLSGLRGAVGLAMAILVESDASESPLDIELRVRVAFFVSGITVLTLFVNGVAITPIYRKLNLYQHSQLQISFLRRMLRKCQDEYESHLTHHMTKHWFFQNVNYDILNKALPNLETLLPNPEEEEGFRTAHFKDVFQRQEAHTIGTLDLLNKKNVETLEDILERRHQGDFHIGKLKILFFEELFENGNLTQEWWKPKGTRKGQARRVHAEQFGGGMEFFIHKAGGGGHHDPNSMEHELEHQRVKTLEHTLHTLEKRLEQSLFDGDGKQVEFEYDADGFEGEEGGDGFRAESGFRSPCHNVGLSSCTDAPHEFLKQWRIRPCDAHLRMILLFDVPLGFRVRRILLFDAPLTDFPLLFAVHSPSIAPLYEQSPLHCSGFRHPPYLLLEGALFLPVIELPFRGGAPGNFVSPYSRDLWIPIALAPAQIGIQVDTHPLGRHCPAHVPMNPSILFPSHLT